MEGGELHLAKLVGSEMSMTTLTCTFKICLLFFFSLSLFFCFCFRALARYGNGGVQNHPLQNLPPYHFAVRVILEWAILSFSNDGQFCSSANSGAGDFEFFNEVGNFKVGDFEVFFNDRFCSLGDSGVGNFEFFNGMGDFAVWAILEWAILSFNVTSDLAV